MAPMLRAAGYARVTPPLPFGYAARMSGAIAGGWRRRGAGMPGGAPGRSGLVGLRATLAVRMHGLHFHPSKPLP